MTRVYGRLPRLMLALALLVVALPQDIDAARARRNPKLDSILRAGVPGDVPVIIRTRSGRESAVRSRLHRAVNRHAFIGAFTTTLHAYEIAQYAQDDDILSMSYDMLVAGGAAPLSASATSDASALLASLHLPSGNLSGKGVGIGIIDSGVAPSTDLAPVVFFDFTSPRTLHPYDDFGHGTHVAGLIGSRNTTYPGVAPRARLVSLKVLDARGLASTSAVIDAIEFATVNKRALGLDVLNLSLGHPILEPADTDPLVLAVEAASRAGLIVVVAAGNVGRNIVSGIPGYAGILSPGNAESAITAGALDTHNTASIADDGVPAYSSRGPSWYTARQKPDVVAPGHNLVSIAAPGSTLFNALPNHQVTVNKNVYFRLSGTSMSAAVTSGVVALMLEAARAKGVSGLAPSLVRNILDVTAVRLAGYDSLTQGYGAIDAGAATALASHAADTPSLLSGWAPPALAPVPLAIWASNVVWSAFADDRDTIVWGTSNDGMDTIVWGTTVDYLDTIVWGTSQQRIER